MRAPGAGAVASEAAPLAGFWAGYDALAAAATVAIFSTAVTTYWFSGLGGGPPPLWWFYALTALIVPSFARPGTLERLLRSGIPVWWVAVTGYTLLSFLWSTRSGLAIDELRVRVLAYSALGVFAAAFAWPTARRAAKTTLALTVLFAVALNIVDALAPRTFSEVFGRSAGFYQNPNSSATAILLALVLTLRHVPARWRNAFTAIAGLGVLLTLSRGLALCYVLAVVMLWRQRLVQPGRLVAMLVLLGAAAVCGAWLVLGSERLATISTLISSSGVLERITDLSVTTGGADYSTTVRAAALEAGWRVFQEHPILGAGVAATVDWEVHTSTHNMFVKQLAEYGLPGLALFVALPILALRGGRRRFDTDAPAVPFAISVLALSLFSHNLLDSWAVLVAYALAIMSSPAAEAESSSPPTPAAD